MNHFLEDPTQRSFSVRDMIGEILQNESLLRMLLINFFSAITTMPIYGVRLAHLALLMLL